MSSYRQMRRHARRARRSGLQSIMVLSSDSQYPAPVTLLVARWAWRYRSELAPTVAAVAVLAAGWWVHATHPH
jgi:hypothetical protein